MTIARIMLAALMLAATARAQSTQPAAEIENPIRRNAQATTADLNARGSSSSFDATRVLTALAAVIGLILLLRWGVKRIAPLGVGQSSRAVQVLARCHVSHKQRILIVQVGRRLLVVGDSGQQLNTLCEINDPDESAALLGQLGKAADAAASFTRVLEKAVANDPDAAHDQPVDDRSMPDEQLSTARRQLNGLAEKVRVVARQLNRA